MKNADREYGATLIELVFSIVILSVATVSLIQLTSGMHAHSADPMVRQQAAAIAQSYLEEIAARSFCDPDWDPDSNPSTTTTCRTSCTAAVCGSCRGNGATTEASRATYDDICDYNGLTDAGARDQNGNAVAALSAYTVATSVETTGVSLNGLQASSGQVALLKVQVSHPNIDTVTIQTYKANSE